MRLSIGAVALVVLNSHCCDVEAYITTLGKRQSFVSALSYSVLKSSYEQRKDRPCGISELYGPPSSVPVTDLAANGVNKYSNGGLNTGGIGGLHRESTYSSHPTTVPTAGNQMTAPFQARDDTDEGSHQARLRLAARLFKEAEQVRIEKLESQMVAPFHGSASMGEEAHQNRLRLAARLFKEAEELRMKKIEQLSSFAELQALAQPTSETLEPPHGTFEAPISSFTTNSANAVEPRRRVFCQDDVTMLSEPASLSSTDHTFSGAMISTRKKVVLQDDLTIMCGAEQTAPGASFSGATNMRHAREKIDMEDNFATFCRDYENASSGASSPFSGAMSDIGTKVVVQDDLTKLCVSAKTSSDLSVGHWSTNELYSGAVVRHTGEKAAVQDDFPNRCDGAKSAPDLSVGDYSNQTPVSGAVRRIEERLALKDDFTKRHDPAAASPDLSRNDWHGRASTSSGIMPCELQKPAVKDNFTLHCENAGNWYRDGTSRLPDSLPRAAQTRNGGWQDKNKCGEVIHI